MRDYGKPEFDMHFVDDGVEEMSAQKGIGQLWYIKGCGAVYCDSDLRFRAKIPDSKKVDVIMTNILKITRDFTCITVFMPFVLMGMIEREENSKYINHIIMYRTSGRYLSTCNYEASDTKYHHSYSIAKIDVFRSRSVNFVMTLGSVSNVRLYFINNECLQLLNDKLEEKISSPLSTLAISYSTKVVILILGKSSAVKRLDIKY